jgi:hypothetical protein
MEYSQIHILEFFKGIKFGLSKVLHLAIMYDKTIMWRRTNMLGKASMHHAMML